MPAPPLAALKQKCAATHEAFTTASARTLQLLTEVELPVLKELRGSLLHQLQVEHEAQERYLAARQELLLFVQEHFRRP
jgi:hypothetical protein